MGIAIVKTKALQGLQIVDVRVEVDITGGAPAFFLVGMAETAVKESRERVRSAILNSKFDFPTRRITVNLSPADLPKEGGRYDLAIAIGILAASKQLTNQNYTQYDFLAELSLNGDLHGIKGVLPSVIKSQNKLILASANSQEAALAKTNGIYPAQNLTQVIQHLENIEPINEYTNSDDLNKNKKYSNDIAQIKGQENAKRALQIAASGNHNILFWGPPGSGKSMLAQALPTILPQLPINQALETAAINSIKNGFSIDAWRKRPFRAPHHTASAVALVGGGTNPAPGEISLAHNGVLFLDELPEFERRVLEVMREPLETGHINISRASKQVCFPANFLLVAAMNPCPCGYLGDSSKNCTCSENQIQKYLAKISGPLLDRIDLQVEVPPISPNQLWEKADEDNPTSEHIKTQVVKTQDLQFKRANKLNSQLSTSEIEQIVNANVNLKSIIENAMNKLNLSARAAHKVVKVARTIADMTNSPNVEENHLLEALSYRNKIAQK